MKVLSFQDVDVFESPLDSMANQETRVSLSEYKESVDSYLKDLFTTSNLEEFILYYFTILIIFQLY